MRGTTTMHYSCTAAALYALLPLPRIHHTDMIIWERWHAPASWGRRHAPAPILDSAAVRIRTAAQVMSSPMSRTLRFIRRRHNQPWEIAMSHLWCFLPSLPACLCVCARVWLFAFVCCHVSLVSYQLCQLHVGYTLTLGSFWLKWSFCPLGKQSEIVSLCEQFLSLLVESFVHESP